MKWKPLLYTILTLALLILLIFNTLSADCIILRTIVFVFDIRCALEYLRILSICVAYGCVYLLVGRLATLLYSHLLQHSFDLSLAQRGTCKCACVYIYVYVYVYIYIRISVCLRAYTQHMYWIFWVVRSLKLNVATNARSIPCIARIAAGHHAQAWPIRSQGL